MILLAVAGVSLAASAIAWWNGRRIEQVEREIEQLELRRAAVLEADTQERRRLVGPYVDALSSAIRAEQRFRAEVSDELRRATGELRGVKGSALGLPDGAIERVLREVERSVFRLESEQAWLRGLTRVVDGWKRGTAGEIFGPEQLVPPVEFPFEGALSALATGSHRLGDYQVRWTDLGRDLSSQAVLFDIDHNTRLARACRARGALVTALLREDPDPLLAHVVRDDPAGLVLEHGGVPLIVPREESRRLRGMAPGDELEVHPGDWTMTEVLHPAFETEAKRFLHVRLQPRIQDTVRRRWSPIPLAVTAPLLKDLDAKLEDAPFDRPWEIRSVSGTSDLSFRLGRADLRVTPDTKARELVLREVKFAESHEGDEPGLKVPAELFAYTPGSPDARRFDGKQLAAFVEALHHGLSRHRAQLHRRRGALALRKLSVIYEDQLEREERESAVHVFVSGSRSVPGGLELDLISLEEQPPEWLVEASGARLPGVALDTGRSRFEVLGLEMMEDLRLRVRAKGLPPEDVARVQRLISTRSGYQQRVLMRALENMELGLTANPEIRSRLLEAGAESVEHELEGPATIRKAIRNNDDLFAVWGPPGAGKTTLIIGLIADFVRDHGEVPTKILVVAPTHVAIDNVLEGLARAHSELEPGIVRYASSDKMDESPVERLWYRHATDEYRSLVNELPDSPITERWRQVMDSREGRHAATRWILSSKRIHGATCVGMASARFGLTDATYDLVVIDEVGKCFAAELILPALKARRLILVGDHYQLPPTVTSDDLDEATGYRLPLEEVEKLLRESYFAMLFRSLPVDRKGMLTTQHRMHPHIGDAVSEVFYGGRLSSGRTEGFGEWMSSRLTVVDCSDLPVYRSLSGPNRRSRLNPFEARGVVRLLEVIRKQRGRLPRTLVVCPYRAQSDEIRRLLREHLPNEDVEVTTVDAVQGGEAPLVILPMTRERGRAEFVLDENRINVALSRAKDAIVVFAHVDHLTRDGSGPLRRLLDHGTQSGTLNHLRMKVAIAPRRDQLRAAVGSAR